MGHATGLSTNHLYTALRYRVVVMHDYDGQQCSLSHLQSYHPALIIGISS